MAFLRDPLNVLDALVVLGRGDDIILYYIILNYIIVYINILY